MYKSIVQVDGTHEAYEKLLHDAEQKLMRISNRSVSAKGGDGNVVAAEAEEEWEEDVIRVFKEGGDANKVDLCGLKLWILPRAFGRLRRVVHLVLSTNQLQQLLVILHLVTRFPKRKRIVENKKRSTICTVSLAVDREHKRSMSYGWSTKKIHPWKRRL